MSDAQDKDQELEHYLRGGSGLSQQYGAASTETPPAELDARILAAARRAVRAGPAPAPLPARKKPWRWQVPLATAAVVVLSATIILRLAEQVHQQPVAGGNIAPATIEAKHSAEPVAPTAEMDDRKNRLEAKSLRLQEKKETVVSAPAEATAAPAGPPQNAAGSLAQPFRDESLSKDAMSGQDLLREDRAPAMKQRAAPAGESRKAELEGRPAPSAEQATAGPQPLPAGESTAFKTPEAWLDHVRELRKEGKFEEAAASLAQFKKTYPGYALPDDLR